MQVETPLIDVKDAVAGMFLNLDPRNQVDLLVMYLEMDIEYVVGKDEMLDKVLIEGKDYTVEEFSAYLTEFLENLSDDDYLKCWKRQKNAKSVFLDPETKIVTSELRGWEV